MTQLVRMWEATCPDAYLDQLSAWLRDEVVPQALQRSGCQGAEAFVGDGEARLVLITRWASREDLDSWEESAGRDVTRSHAWTFRPIP